MNKKKMTRGKEISKELGIGVAVKKENEQFIDNVHEGASENSGP